MSKLTPDQKQSAINRVLVSSAQAVKAVLNDLSWLEAHLDLIKSLNNSPDETVLPALARKIAALKKRPR